MSNLKRSRAALPRRRASPPARSTPPSKSARTRSPTSLFSTPTCPCSCAACFTTNKFCAAPVILDREILKKGKARAVVINSGNANAATGKRGHRRRPHR